MWWCVGLNSMRPKDQFLGCGEYRWMVRTPSQWCFTVNREWLKFPSELKCSPVACLQFLFQMYPKCSWIHSFRVWSVWSIYCIIHLLHDMLCYVLALAWNASIYFNCYVYNIRKFGAEFVAFCHALQTFVWSFGFCGILAWINLSFKFGCLL